MSSLKLGGQPGGRAKIWVGHGPLWPLLESPLNVLSIIFKLSSRPIKDKQIIMQQLKQ